MSDTSGHAGTGIAAARSLVLGAIVSRVFPAAVAEVGTGAGPIWREAFGTLAFHGSGGPALERTVFDLASLTKPIATSTVILALAARRSLGLDEPLAACLAEWRGHDRVSVTVRDLLEHASGLPARLVDPAPRGRREFEHDICALPLEYAPRSRALYSDLGFILLGFLAADRGGAPLDALFDTEWRLIQPTGEGEDALEFKPAVERRRQVAPTRPLPEDERRGRMLAGDVHDPYASALGGVAGHAGLFGTAGAVGTFARAMLPGAHGAAADGPFSAPMVALATRKSDVPESSRALGWDTMLPTSSCGTRMSPAAFGHVGFTGTSLWIDPVRDRYFVLLTNRACGDGTLDQMRELRRGFHDALGDI